MSTNPWVTGPIVLLTNDTIGTNETERSINHNCVDNHACILLSIKNTLGIQKKGPQKVIAVLRPPQARIRGQLIVYRTDSEQEQETLPSSDALCTTLSTTPAGNSVYNSNLQLRYTTTHYRAYYRLPRKILLPRLLLLLPS